EHPEQLWLLHPDRAATLLSRGNVDLSEDAGFATRVPPGHPERYVLSFATLYREFLLGVLNRLNGEPYTEATKQLPTADDGVQTLRLIAAAETSQDEERRVQ